jgi:hypothetical protein
MNCKNGKKNLIVTISQNLLKIIINVKINRKKNSSLHSQNLKYFLFQV